MQRFLNGESFDEISYSPNSFTAFTDYFAHIFFGDGCFEGLAAVWVCFKNDPDFVFLIDNVFNEKL